MNPIITSLQQKTLHILVTNTSGQQPISSVEIAKQIGLKDRDNGVRGYLRSIIHALRVKGFPICASGRGYFYAHTQEELSKFILNMEHRLLSQQEAIEGLKNSYHNIKGDLPQTIAPITPAKIKLPVRLNGAVRYQEFDVDPTGEPIVPEGVDVIK